MEEIQNKNEQPESQNSSLKTVGAFVWDLVKILVIALVIIVPFRMFVAEPFVVSGSSMLPNYHNYDYLIVDRISYLTGAPKRGDVIVLRPPLSPSEFYIKRIIGLPGETVKFSQGHVIIVNAENPQGLTLNESYLPSQVETIAANQSVTLGDGEYFVLGDNRGASSDSRVWGILPKGNIIGKVFSRIYPFSDLALIKTPSY